MRGNLFVYNWVDPILREALTNSFKRGVGAKMLPYLIPKPKIIVTPKLVRGLVFYQIFFEKLVLS